MRGRSSSCVRTHECPCARAAQHTTTYLHHPSSPLLPSPTLPIFPEQPYSCQMSKWGVSQFGSFNVDLVGKAWKTVETSIDKAIGMHNLFYSISSSVSSSPFPFSRSYVPASCVFSRLPFLYFLFLHLPLYSSLSFLHSISPLLLYTDLLPLPSPFSPLPSPSPLSPLPSPLSSPLPLPLPLLPTPSLISLFLPLCYRLIEL